MTQNASSPDENITQLRTLALRLLARSFSAQEPQPQLLAGRLPDPLPFDLLLPAGSHIIGSFVSSPEEIQIVLDSDQSPAEIAAFYTEQMQALGWSEPDSQRRQNEGGFVHTFHRPTIYITLCKGLHGPALGVAAIAGENEKGKTDVRLHIDTRSRNSPCRQASAIFMQVNDLIPPLRPPADGHQQSGGGGSNSESASTSATLEMKSAIALPALADHYTFQLDQAGWQRTGEGNSEQMAWNTWEFRDKQNERWGGVFTLLQLPGMERSYYLQILINWLEGTSL